MEAESSHFSQLLAAHSQAFSSISSSSTLSRQESADRVASGSSLSGHQEERSPAAAAELSVAQFLANEILTHKQNAKAKIEELVLGVIDSIMDNRFPSLERPRLLTNSKDIRKANTNPAMTTKIVFGGRSSRTFAMQMHVMAIVHKMICQDQTSTMRDLYYENLNFFGNQNRLSVAIKEVSLLLKVPREALCVEASAKGLIAGSISFTNANGDVIRASDSRHGIIVPNKLHELNITTDASCILFVEKDATFQRLLDEGVLAELGPIILITGKGYPDMQTRRLMCILNRMHRLKVYALVDCDPYGIEIAAVVKWGSYRNCNGHVDENQYLNTDLSVPDLVWLGLLPSEVGNLSLPYHASAELNDKDRRKLQSVTERIQLQNHDPWLVEVNTLLHIGRKTELEALFSSPMFTTKVYLPAKLSPVIRPSYPEDQMPPANH